MEEGVEERSYGRSVAATECAMAAMDRTMEDRSYNAGIRSDHTQQPMVAMERTMEERSYRAIMVATDGLINGGNGAIIQSNRWPISGGN